MGFNWEKTGFIIQGMAGFESFLSGFFSVLSDNKIKPGVITTEGASISAAMCYSAGISLTTIIEQLKTVNTFSTPPEAVLTNMYYNSAFHSTQALEYAYETIKGSYATNFTYHFHYNSNNEKIQELMTFPVYTSIINLLTGENKTINLKEFDMKKNIWLGTRIPYFKPVKIENEIYVEDHLRNPPIKEILNNHDVENFIVLKSYPQSDKEPKNIYELQDRLTDLSMNSYLTEQLFFIEKVNNWVKQGLLPKEKYRKIDLYTFGINPSPFEYLDYTPQGIQAKFDLGIQKGEEFLKSKVING